MGKSIGKVDKSLFPNTSHLYICKCNPSILVRSLCQALGRLEALGWQMKLSFLLRHLSSTLMLFMSIYPEYLLTCTHMCIQTWLFTLLSYALMNGDILFVLRDTKKVTMKEFFPNLPQIRTRTDSNLNQLCHTSSMDVY